jgi:hypothetical protein
MHPCSHTTAARSSTVPAAPVSMAPTGGLCTLTAAAKARDLRRHLARPAHVPMLGQPSRSLQARYVRNTKPCASSPRHFGSHLALLFPDGGWCWPRGWDRAAAVPDVPRARDRAAWVRDQRPQCTRQLRLDDVPHPPDAIHGRPQGVRPQVCASGSFLAWACVQRPYHPTNAAYRARCYPAARARRCTATPRTATF